MPKAPSELETVAAGDPDAAAGSSRAVALDPPLASHSSGAALDTLPPVAPLRLHQSILVLGTAAQIATVLNQWRNAAPGQSSSAAVSMPLLILAIVAATAALTVAAPALYWRWHKLTLTAGRVLVYCIPSFRQVGVGAAVMLEAAPQAGWRGAASDLARTATGVRLLGLSVGGLVVPLPPAATLATQLLLLLLTANSAGYCGCRLLAARLMRQRAKRLARLLDVAALPVLLLLQDMSGSEASRISQEGTTPDAACRAVLQFLQLTLGVLLPTIVSAYAWKPPPEEAGEQSLPPAQPAAQPRLELPLAGSILKAAWLACRRAARCAPAAGDAADRLVWLACCSGENLAAQAAAAYYLAALCWSICKQLAGLPPLPG